MISGTKLNGVYYVESSSPEHPLNPLAICPKFIISKSENGEDRCEWKDTGRGSYFFYEKMEIEPNKKDPKLPPERITLIDGKDARVTLLLLTKKIFDEKVPVFGDLKFGSNEELQEYYLKTEFPYL